MGAIVQNPSAPIEVRTLWHLLEALERTFQKVGHIAPLFVGSEVLFREHLEALLCHLEGGLFLTGALQRLAERVVRVGRRRIPFDDLRKIGRDRRVCGSA